MTSLITILHPGIEERKAAAPRLAARVDSLQGKRVALLDNGKVNAGAILDAVGKLLQTLGVAEVKAWRKQHAAQGGEKLFPDILAWKPDIVLAGLGD